MTFSDWPWRHWRRLREEAQALRLNERRLSWRELCAQIDALAAGFHARGVRDGVATRVAGGAFPADKASMESDSFKIGRAHV